MRIRRPASPGIVLPSVLAVLVLVNLAENGRLPSLGLADAVVAIVLLSVVVWWAGGTRDDVGLGAGTFGRGARWALALIGIVASVYLVGALLPFIRELFSDARTGHLQGGEVALRMFVYVPLGTVLLEEYAFRGVLYGLVRRYRGVRAATAVSSLLFGLWHVLPSLHLATQKPALTAVFGHTPIGAVVADLGAVLFTSAAGVVFCELRRRSDSLLAPIGLHWSTNALGYLAAYVLARAR
ncbi:CPBP family intramembrane metalloprotease [Streptacidiphilus pinicola]|uniref:CPBP family intramembrane metalloprotease n=1 Tax=Streptacidiphilus pinicola TaxID=2219663 RepID=A0A2X0KE29_9ACTN|nr:CPBP family intramembrane glutamic endopeptidase [Streptacidiphilus pinicola]RAG87295.1 CPBP family intramembrane metalloprotease [Streptacidiphilus pinicola]